MTRSPYRIKTFALFTCERAQVMSQCMWTDPIHERNNTVTSQVAPGCMNLMSVGYNFPLPKRVPFPLPPLPCLEKRHMSRLQRAAGASYVSPTESGGSVICLACRERRKRQCKGVRTNCRKMICRMSFCQCAFCRRVKKSKC